MREYARYLSFVSGRFFPFRLLLEMDTPVFLPFYHIVSNEKLPHILNYNYRNTAEFEKELDFYLKYFEPVSLGDLIIQKNTKKKIFHLSFDDGLRECAEVIAPVLLKKGIPATFFINSGFVDNRRLFHRYKASLVLTKIARENNPEVEHFLKNHHLQHQDVLKMSFLKEDILDEVAKLAGVDTEGFLKIQKPFLTIQQINELKSQGFSIGAHSSNHPEFWKISEDEQLEEIKTSMKWLVENINPEIKAFSFPFTDSGVSLKVINGLKTENICDVTFGTAGIKYDEAENHFQRYPVEKPGNFYLNLKGEYVYFVIRKIFGKATVRH